MRRPSYFASSESDHLSKKDDNSWKASVSSWHNDLQDLGIVKNPNETAKKIQEAGTTSVLACL